MRRATFLLALIAVLVLASEAASGQTYHEYETNGHYYLLVTTGTSWSNAKTEAAKLTYEGMQGHLATITTAGENSFIKSTVCSDSGVYWFGATDQNSEGDWRWVSGETWSYTSWGGNEPNNSGGAEHVAEFNASNGLWNDNRDYRTYGYIVEFENLVSVEIDSGATGTTDTEVTLTLRPKYSLDLEEVRIRNDEDSWGSWESFASTKTWTLSSGEGEKTVQVEIRDSEQTVHPAEDTIWLDFTPPTGAIVIEGGTGWTEDLFVDLDLSWTDLQSGVTHMRIRNAGEDWVAWIDAASTQSWTLLAGDGPKTVEAQFRDGAGNESAVVSDTVEIDDIPPEVTLHIDGGNVYTSSTAVALDVAATDVGSGVMDMRFRPGIQGADWGSWVTYQPTYAYAIYWGEGPKTVEAQVRDYAGNVSDTVSDSITIDKTPPECTSFRVNRGEPYVAPQEDLEFEIYGSDPLGGSGVEGFKASFDGGESWSDWISLFGGYLATVPKPDVDGIVTARVVVRDKVGNESDSRDCTCYLVENDLPVASGGGKLSGEISPAMDVDAVALDLVEGDVLTVKLKARSGDRKKAFILDLDLVSFDGERLIEGRYPAEAKKVMIAGYVVEETGKYIVVVHRAKDCEAEKGSHGLSIKVKQDKANKKAKGALSGGEILIEAGQGSALKLSLKGEGLTAADVTIQGPTGPIAFEAKEKKGKVTILPTVLDAGTGTYTIRIAGPVEVGYKWSLKLPKKIKATITN
jgi:hypothetical protein